MSDISQAQFYEAMQQMRDLIDEKHASQRIFIADRADRIEHQIAEHAKEDRLVADRVLTLENERDTVKRQTVSRSTIIALVIAIPGAALALYTLLHVK